MGIFGIRLTIMGVKINGECFTKENLRGEILLLFFILFR